MKNGQEHEIHLNHEDEVRLMLVERYKGSYGEQVKEKVELLLNLDGYAGRFNWMQSVLKDTIESLHSILISGYGAGSEMIVAQSYGFQEIHGVEVDSSLLDATKTRLAELPGMFPALYDGSTLPYNDERFDVVVSGHIIEHTKSPKEYLCETMRVIKPGGFLFIEFPSRYHYVELHTGLISFEWLPTSIRNFALNLISSRFSILNSNIKSRYSSILSTGLKQISRYAIFQMLKQLNIPYRELAYSVPAPGIVRSIIEKK